MNKPYFIKIFLPGGDPDGLRTIEKSVLRTFPVDVSLGKNGITTMTTPKNAGKPSRGTFDHKAARAGARRSPPCSF
jgi:hypothetical protein